MFALRSLFIIFSLTFLSNTAIPGNEVQTVKNKPTPIYGNLDLSFTEEVLFDCSELDEELNIYSIIDIAVDSDNNILIIAGNYIFKINPLGEFLKSFQLRKGQGPGEIQQYASSLQLDSKDNIYLKDSFRVLVFDKDMKFIRNVHLGLHNSLFIDDRGFLYTMKHVHSDEGRTKVLTKFDRDGNVIKEFASYKDGKLYKSPRGMTLITRHYYSPDSIFLLNSDNHIIYGINLDYKLFKYDLDGNLESTFVVDEKPHNISSKEKNVAIERVEKVVRSNFPRDWNLDFPDSRPFIKRMMSDEKGRIYVFRKKSILDEDRNEIVDIFSKEGLYLYQIKLPLIQRALLFSIPISICNGSIYFSDYSTRDELGVAIPKLKRLRIKEYESLKY